MKNTGLNCAFKCRGALALVWGVSVACAVPGARGQLFDPVIDLGRLNGDDGFTMLGVATGEIGRAHV